MKLKRNLNGQAKLTYDNISHVHVHYRDGIAYEYAVAMKSRAVSDTRMYLKADSYGNTIMKEFPKSDLPKCVQRFINENTHNTIYRFDNDLHTWIINRYPAAESGWDEQF